MKENMKEEKANQKTKHSFSKNNRNKVQRM
jgi:hypothetical protein